ncbi:MAG: type II toxin-antitoxin system RelE/ParE family toxin [Proteobacteria bacterium]|nr:type II toxin-antitoxin system RelE/ParE family toxin [Pseudomonadota bacterium]
MKDIIWLGNSLTEVRSFPEAVKDEVGFSLYRVQNGENPPASRPLKGFKEAVYEIISNYDRNTYRAVYVVNLGDNIFVLAAFMKKSVKGRKTQKHIMDLVKQRLKAAREIAGKEGRK